MSAQALAYQVTKYQGRNGYTHRDLLRLAHPKASGAVQDVLHYAVKGWPSIGVEVPNEPHLKYLWAVEKAKTLTPKGTGVSEMIDLIREYNLPRECIPTVFLKEKAIWAALLEKMPMTAMIRNLATMSRVGLLTPLSDASATVVGRLRNAELLKKARIHPIQVLSALRVYSAGGAGGLSKGGTFTPRAPIQAALNEAFYLSFGFVEPTGKRTLLGLDTSSSMGSGEVAGVPGLSPREAAAAMAMVTARSEWSDGKIKFPLYHSINFTTTVQEFPLSPTDSLEDVVHRMRNQRHGGTDCSQPMLYAKDRKIPVDTFIVYTDNETWAGHVHPSQALEQYRKAMGINAKLVVVGFTSTGFSIARQGDPTMLDVVGFDSATPALISEFSQGNI